MIRATVDSSGARLRCNLTGGRVSRPAVIRASVDFDYADALNAGMLSRTSPLDGPQARNLIGAGGNRRRTAYLPARNLCPRELATSSCSP